MLDAFDRCLSLEMLARLQAAFRIGTEEGADAAFGASLLPGSAAPALVDDHGGGCGAAVRSACVASSPSTPSSSLSLPQQYVTDAIDAWMAARPMARNRQLVVACGVEKHVIEIKKKKRKKVKGTRQKAKKKVKIIIIIIKKSL